jgi:hypothetical protein
MTSKTEEISPSVYCKMIETDVPRARCMFCPYGHMLTCHYPLTCAEAECDHYLREIEEEY